MLSARFEVAEDGSVGDVTAVLDIASIDTGHAKRDADLRKPGLLDLASTLNSSSAGRWFRRSTRGGR